MGGIKHLLQWVINFSTERINLNFDLLGEMLQWEVDWDRQDISWWVDVGHNNWAAVDYNNNIVYDFYSAKAIIFCAIGKDVFYSSL